MGLGLELCSVFSALWRRSCHCLTSMSDLLLTTSSMMLWTFSPQINSFLCIQLRYTLLRGAIPTRYNRLLHPPSTDNFGKENRLYLFYLKIHFLVCEHSQVVFPVFFSFFPVQVGFFLCQPFYWGFCGNNFGKRQRQAELERLQKGSVPRFAFMMKNPCNWLKTTKFEAREKNWKSTWL